MTNFDLSQFSNMSWEQFITQTHTYTAQPALVIQFAVMLLVLLIVGLLLVKNKGLFFTIFAIVAGISLAVLLMLYFMPNTVYSVSMFFKELLF